MGHDRAGVAEPSRRRLAREELGGRITETVRRRWGRRAC